jgi:hypothetical protein
VLQCSSASHAQESGGRDFSFSLVLTFSVILGEVVGRALGEIGWKWDNLWFETRRNLGGIVPKFALCTPLTL